MTIANPAYECIFAYCFNKLYESEERAGPYKMQVILATSKIIRRLKDYSRYLSDGCAGRSGTDLRFAGRDIIQAENEIEREICKAYATCVLYKRKDIEFVVFE